MSQLSDSGTTCGGNIEPSWDMKNHGLPSSMLHRPSITSAPDINLLGDGSPPHQHHPHTDTLSIPPCLINVLSLSFYGTSPGQRFMIHQIVLGKQD